MKEIQLSQGKVAYVDDQDYDLLSQWKWFAAKWRNTYRAGRQITVGRKKQKTIYMHRAIMQLIDPKMQVDHIDRNGLNNQRANLRIVTNSQNRMNTVVHSNSTTGVKGVYWHKATGKYSAQLGAGGKTIWLGLHDSIADARAKHLDAVKKYHGEFAPKELFI